MGLALMMFGLAILVTVGYILWAYRKQSAEKVAARSERYRQLFAPDHKTEAPSAPATPRPQSGNLAAAVGRASARAAYAPRERLLTPHETLIYYVLKAGMPDHEIFVRVSLAALVEMSPRLPEFDRSQLARRLALQYVDFVVCDKRSRIIAAVDFEAGVDDRSDGAEFKMNCLTGAGIRHIRIPAAAIPKKEEVRAMIYGSPDGADLSSPVENGPERRAGRNQ